MKLDPRGSTVLGEDRRRHLARVQQSVASDGRDQRRPIPLRHPGEFHHGRRRNRDQARDRMGRVPFDGAAVTFEADQFAASRRTGWSVVVEGVARVVPYDDVGRLGANFPTPIVKVPGVRVFEIVPFKVTGRSVEPDLRGERGDLAAGRWPEAAGESPEVDPHLGRDAAGALSSALGSTLGDLSSEIADTDNPVFRKTLLERRRLLESVAAELRLPTPPDSTPVSIRVKCQSSPLLESQGRPALCPKAMKIAQSPCTCSISNA